MMYVRTEFCGHGPKRASGGQKTAIALASPVVHVPQSQCRLFYALR